MGKLYSFSLFFFIVTSFCFSQNKVNKNDMVGYGCYLGGTPTKAVQKMNQLLNNKQYDKILSWIYSKKESKKYLAVIVSEKLESLGYIQIDEKAKSTILLIRNSKKLVSVCSACTYWDKMTLKKALDKDGKWQKFTEYWLDEKFGKTN